jgi:hypothetical protein
MKDTSHPRSQTVVARDQDGRRSSGHETHGSWVFVAGDRALKVKKPVVLPFLDDGTLERRRAMCARRCASTAVWRPRSTAARSPWSPAGARLFVDPDDEASGAVEVAVGHAPL